MGGTQPSYQRIGEALKRDPGSHIEQSRMPANFLGFRDLKHWTRAEIQAWSMHILDGQRGLIPPERRFGWRIIPRPRAEPPRIQKDFHLIPARGASIRWTTAELRYAELANAARISVDHPNEKWKGLPLARTSHIYSPYTGTLYQELMHTHQGDDALIGVIQEAARMEQLGPIHVRNTSKVFTET